MSEAVSALKSAEYQGFARVSECGLRGMITVRGDLASRKLTKAVEDATGQQMPKPRMVNTDGPSGIAWMSPDELLVMVPYADVTGKLAQIDKALAGEFAMAVNVSDARAVFALNGNAREVLAKLSPADMRRSALPAGEMRRTRLAQVPAAFFADADDAFTVVCFRSVAHYVFDLLKAASDPSSDVGYF
ncbi:sarcosine oxidase subunit gamma [Nereida sp. MMG025]|uniref:sarcosine oxidase subunit gamma n=1 Tax=Nereida sp. MMG025 TaxID=2909981 RepID=UPI001F22B852|nr:sarcosine oxidase subunit gamma family protein [Nereida sp. MMG025]MCF6445407.1 sarcosine oxidase subunit gamma family protein [Nereida sp. MMG025]